MKRRRKIVTLLVVILAIFLGLGIFYIFTKEDKESTLSLIDKQWIEKNKNEMIDFGIVNNIAILNTNTDSLIFDFINSLEDATGLDFNKVSHNYDDEFNEEYSFRVVDEVTNNDILIYQDNYVLVGKDNKKINNLNELNNAKVAVLTGKIDNVSRYLNNSTISYKAVDSDYESILVSFKNDSGFDYIVMPKLVFLSCYAEYDKLYINYNITEMKDNYVISLGSLSRLNDILTKYYKKWSSDNYTKSFNSGLISAYYNYSKVDEQQKAKFRSKRYVYGLVETYPFDVLINGNLYGINKELINNFSDITDVEITYKKYDTVDNLKKALSSNEIDFMFDRYSTTEYDMDVYNTGSSIDESVVVISNKKNNITINSVYSLDNFDIATLANTKVEEYLIGKAHNIKSYVNLKDLLKYDGIIVIDELIYNFYKDSTLEDYKIDYRFDLNDNYTFVFRDIKNNEVFEDFFNFYIAFVDENLYTIKAFNELKNITLTGNGRMIIVTIILALIIAIISFLIGGRFAPTRKHEKKRKINMKKEDKLRYVDMLTSLKNRNYLNDNIEKWDESEAYPQSVIIIDLNNVAYINDNYGHQEGDNVIKEAASKLIENQLPNSEIIRTNGNEFLLYLVGYDEKQVVNYIKKLNKDLKEISHGFGAATGYSMITDGIKTIDDAVNEATLDMRQNKEESN